jgi:hypothetical protein
MSARKGVVGKGLSPERPDEYVSIVSFAAWRPQLVALHNTAAAALRDEQEFVN